MVATALGQELACDERSEVKAFGRGHNVFTAAQVHVEWRTKLVLSM